MSSYLKTPTEDSEQAALFEWASYWSQNDYPELALLFAIPNGGKRSIKTASTLKRTGVKAGVPDTFLPVSRGGKHGLFIEMKRTSGSRISVEQKEWMIALEQQGFKAQVCYGWQEAADTIAKYLGIQVS